MEFYDTPRKIKKLRNQLSMKQYELASAEVSSAFISMVELGKRGLSSTTADRIADKLREKAASIGITLNIDGAYLLLSPEEEAERYCLEKLKEATNIEETKPLVPICEKYRLDGALSKIYRFIGDLSYKEQNYEGAFEAYSYAIDLCKGTNEKGKQPYLYNRCGLCKLNLVRYKEALFYFDRATYHARIYNDSEFLQRSIYNSAMCYHYLGEYETALDLLPHFFEIADKETMPDPYIRALILKANCYKDSGRYDEALEAYNAALQEKDYLNPHFQGKIYTNIAGTYLEKGDYVTSLDYFNKAQRIRNEFDKFGLPSTMIEKAQIYIRQGFYEDAVVMIELALETASQYANYACLLAGYKSLEEIYSKMGDVERLKVVFEEHVKLLQKLGKKDELVRATNSLAFLHLKDRDIDAAQACLEITQENHGKSFNRVV